MKKIYSASGKKTGIIWKETEMFDNVKAGKQIATFRKNKGFTQEDVARYLNISPQAVSKWENGMPV